MRRALLVTSLLVSGCASIDPARGHSDVAKSVEARTGLKTHWENGTPEDADVAKRVDELIHDGLTRERAVEIALVNNRRLQATYEELGISQAELVQAGLLKNPTFSGSVGFPILSGITETEFQLAQDFLDLFILPLRKKVAAEQFAADTARVTDAALQIATETSVAFVDVQAGAKEQELLGTLRETAVAARELARRQREAGNITELALASQEATASTADLEFSRAQLRLLEAREHLNRLLGLFGPQTAWKLAAELQPLPEKDPSLEHAESRAIRDRLDVEAARRTADLMEEAVSVARTSRATGFVEIGIHTHQDPNGPRLTGPTLSLELPIFDQRTALIARLEAQARQSRKTLEAVSIDVRSEVRVAVARFTIARRAAEQYSRELLPLRERVLQQAQLQYNAMQLGPFELLQAKREQTDAYRGYLQSLRDYWAARAELERAIGGSLNEGAKR
ncbi:MAG: TolC family protein [Myxococcaceae bacterium]